MPKRRPKILGTPAPRSYRIPLCSVHRVKTRRDVDGRWVCPECADEWLKARARDKIHKTETGIVLPAGVLHPSAETASFNDVWPNREARREARKHVRRTG